LKCLQFQKNIFSQHKLQLLNCFRIAKKFKKV
jgi:hypothetical protein